MIISHKHKFIFIKTRKVAGTSIELFLRKHLGPDDIATKLPRENFPAINCSELIDEHCGWQRVVKDWPMEFTRYYTFSLDRNPWDKMVSAYFYYSTYFLDNKGKTVHDFMNWTQHPDRQFPNDWSKYANESGIALDDLFKYESLHEWFPEVCARLNIPYNNELEHIRAKSHCRDFKEYRHLYTDDTKQKVAEQFSQIIKHFNYEF